MAAVDNPGVSIIIKAYNEAEHIDRCIDSALRALSNLHGEVILADSGSTDGTVAIARRHPIRIVQLADIQQRRCGIGPQLGYQFARFEFVYILDGDMQLDPEFLPAALRYLAANAGSRKLAGVAGLVEERSEENVQFRRRKARNEEGIPGPKLWLGMGGLYDRRAIESVGYFSNRNLFAHEEQDLGVRLAARGWQLERMDRRSVIHYGHTDSSLALLLKRLRSGYIFGSGQALRACRDWPAVRSYLHELRHLLVTLALLLGLLVLLVSPLSNFAWLWLVAIAAMLVQRIYRYRNLRDGALCVVIWHVSALAFVYGLLLPQQDPALPIDALVLQEQRKVTS